jgi:hypothetical protein
MLYLTVTYSSQVRLVVFGALVGPVVGPDVGALVFGALLVGELVGPNVGLLVFGALVRELVVGPDVGVLLFLSETTPAAPSLGERAYMLYDRIDSTR